MALAFYPFSSNPFSQVACLRPTYVEACMEAQLMNRAYGIAASKSNTPINLACRDYVQYRATGAVYKSLLLIETPRVPS
ncbi:hypothetical protein PanWU01x14_009370 [Parasponia andersonii]|uniref:Uncharacterized protein n=1 Tax=Parasponia andersonii TaxID=3476 RepID=A0A2P5E2D6_PARAD|nr:hypothetical protein PanWU01x14_009370 [Parasponia andersonii]